MFKMNVLMMTECNLVDSHPSFSLRGGKYSGLFFTRNDLHAHARSLKRLPLIKVKASSVRKYEKRAGNGKARKTRTLKNIKIPSRSSEDTRGDIQKIDGDVDTSVEPFNGKLGEDSPIKTATRSSVLQACITTTGLLLALGVLIRQASHVASMQGWPIHDASTEVSFSYSPVDFEPWHIELIGGLILLITSCRFILLKAWPDFAESSEAANHQVLGSLEPLDYIVVAFLPGISEELLFRGALLPLFGLTWKSALVVGAVFGALHLGSGRRCSFAVWASFVGFVYGLATIISSSMIVPMVAHSLNNLIGGILWKYSATPLEKNR